MSHIGKNGNIVGKTPRAGLPTRPIISKAVIFAHKASSGEAIVNLSNLAIPTELTVNGFIQPDNGTILGCRIGINRRKLKVTSLLRGTLHDYYDYKVLSASQIQILIPGGLQLDEVLIMEIESSSDIIAASSKNITKTYTLAAGQTLLNLGQQYKVNESPTENAGIIKVYYAGVRAYRNTGNSIVVQDKDYYEVDSGNGYGTTLVFNSAPTIPVDILVDFGTRAITDSSAMDTIEALQGSFLKLAEDFAQLAGTALSDYTSANPAEVERRTFGDTVLGIQDTIANLSTGKLLRVTVFSASGTWTRGSDVNSILVRAVGGGGGGGSLSAGFGGGGGGGGSCEKFISAPLSSYAVTIGAGGGAASTGGTTTFGAVVTANGGAGGVTNNGQPGAGGTATGGDINAKGNGGTIGFSSGGYGGSGTGGGSAFFGGGAQGVNGTVAGAPNTGGGGNGVGGTGGSGIVVVYEFR